MSRRDFHFAGRALRVEAAEEPLAWLQEFVTPQFAAKDTEAPDRIITLVVDAREHARLLGHGAHPQHLRRACFTLDSGIVHGRVWRVPGAREVVRDEERELFYRHCPGEGAPQVEIVAARDDTDARLVLLRVVREYATLYATRAGWLLLHAAAVCVGDGAFVIAGPKHAGKTTLLLHALRHERGTYVANDRVALSAGPSGLTVHGIPTIMSIRRRSADWFADLDTALTSARYHYSHRLAEGRPTREVASSKSATGWGLSPAQLCHVLGVESRAAAPVTAMLFPRVEALADGMAFQALDAAQALEAWHGALFRAHPQEGMFAIERDTAPPPGGDMGSLAARFAAHVPNFACRLGPGAYASGGAMRALISRHLPAQTMA